MLLITRLGLPNLYMTIRVFCSLLEKVKLNSVSLDDADYGENFLIFLTFPNSLNSLRYPSRSTHWYGQVMFLLSSVLSVRC